jgi:hypothetical protein
VTAVAAAVNTLPIGRQVDLSKLYIPAQLYGTPYYDTFELMPNGITIARSGNAQAAADVPIAFNELAVSSAGNFSISIIP